MVQPGRGIETQEALGRRENGKRQNWIDRRDQVQRFRKKREELSFQEYDKDEVDKGKKAKR
jgi:hypothetical protein